MVKEDPSVTQVASSSASLFKKIGRTTESVIGSMCQVLNILGIVVLLAMTAMTVIDVIGRIFKRPIIGSTEITEFMMVTIVFLCIGWAAVKGKMITVDLVTMHLSARMRAILNSFTLFLGLGVMIMITWRSVLAAIDVQKDNVFTIILHIPSYPFMWLLSVGFAVLCLVMVMQVVQNVMKAARG